MLIDYDAHNAEVGRLLGQRRCGCCERILMELSVNPRIIILNPTLNTDGVTFERYYNSPEEMARIQLQFHEYVACSLLRDSLMGPEHVNYTLYPDLQNMLEPAWLGCEICFPRGGQPAARKLLTDENKGAYLCRPLPEPFSGEVCRAEEYRRAFLHLEEQGFSRGGRPVYAAAKPAGMGTDGPFTLACSLRGATEMCIDLYEDTGFAMELLSYITEATVRRIKALRRSVGLPEMLPSFSFADDSIALLSCSDYERFVLPFHRKLIAELATGEQANGMHLCGDATRHFPTMVRELNINRFDTGYPVDHGKLVRELGESVTVSGGVHVDILRAGTPQSVADETRRILQAVLPCRNFTIKEANNLSPCTPEENIAAMYETVRKYGRY